MRWLISNNRAKLVFALLLSVVAYLFAGALMFTSGYMISLAATIPLTVLALHLPSIFVRIFGIGKPPIQYAYRLSSHDWVLQMTSRLRLSLYDALRMKTTVTQSRESTGKILSMLTDDIGHAQDSVLRGVLPIASAWIVAIVIVALAGAMSATLALCLFALLVVSCVIVPLITSSMNVKELEELKIQSDSIYVKLADNSNGLIEWIISGRKTEFIDSQLGLLEEKGAIESRIRRRRRICLLISQVLFCLCIIAITVWAAMTFAPALQNDLISRALAAPSDFAEAVAGVIALNASPYPANWIAAFALCFFPLIEAFSTIEVSAETYKKQHANIEELIDYMGDSAKKTPQELLQDENLRPAVAPNLDTNNENLRPSMAPNLDTAEGTSHRDTSEGTSDLEVLKKTPAIKIHNLEIPKRTPAIKIHNLAFSYDDNQVFDDFYLEVPYGEKIAIIGKSGVGKSTLVSLIHGDLRPDSGSISIGDVEAADLFESMHEYIGILGQFPYLFDMSLRDNLLIANQNASDDELEDALNLVGLARTYESLSDGLNTRMSEQGMRFSGGERHRIALARLFLANQPIIILDEPFANLDSQTQDEILDKMFEIFKDKTVIVITHHGNSLSRFDRMIRI